MTATTKPFLDSVKWGTVVPRAFLDEVTTPWQDDMLRMFYGAPRPAQRVAPPARGDKVTITRTGYVSDVDEFGGFAIVDKRAAFDDDVTHVDEYGPDDPGTTVRVIERAPAAPKVGDLITGDTVRATPWRRGTILRYVQTNGTDGTAYVLMADGTWTCLDKAATGIEFEHFVGAARFRVEHAPGK